jgi:hypothetical protein
MSLIFSLLTVGFLAIFDTENNFSVLTILLPCLFRLLTDFVCLYTYEF